MNNDYFDYQKSLNVLTLILSIGYFYKYSFKVIQSRIVNSKYFIGLNKKSGNSIIYESSKTILNEIYYDADIDENMLNIYYDELEWVAMVYLNIVNKAGLDFETIFYYAPIREVIDMYKIYHELDINKTYKWFIEKKEKQSILKIRMNELKIANDELAEKCSLSPSMIDALKNRRRDIKKLDLERALKLANVINVKVETLLNN